MESYDRRKAGSKVSAKQREKMRLDSMIYTINHPQLLSPKSELVGICVLYRFWLHKLQASKAGDREHTIQKLSRPTNKSKNNTQLREFA
jgi:hypothetical protein